MLFGCANRFDVVAIRRKRRKRFMLDYLILSKIDKILFKWAPIPHFVLFAFDYLLLFWDSKASKT